MTDLEYTLCCDHPFGLYRVRALCTSMATQVFQCIKQLERLDPAPCPALYARFGELQKLVAEEVYEPEACLLGPLVVPLCQDDAGCLAALQSEGRVLVDPATARLEKLRPIFPGAVPQGFVVTAAGCQHYFQSGDLQSEINRCIQAAGGLAPNHLARLSKKLGALVEGTPLPEDLASAILEQVQRLRGLCNKPMCRTLSLLCCGTRAGAPISCAPPSTWTLLTPCCGAYTQGRTVMPLSSAILACCKQARDSMARSWVTLPCRRRI